ncbi:MAG TPA: AAA family ATPase, partial [Microlunatus sp.]|nr:AAA family ATPase [Microlunatus sp.]
LMRKVGVADRRTLARVAPPPDAVRGAGAWPTELTSFVGRERERTALLTELGRRRMVMVTGPGGVGKTRLAIAAVREHAGSRRDGGMFVDLVGVTDPGMVVAAVARAARVPELHGRPLTEAVCSALTTRDAVLLLDNCEHLLGAAAHITERLLSSCPTLSVVATSRVRFAAPYEWVFEVPGMSVSGDGGDAVRLFLERAVAAAGGITVGFDHRQVSALCRSLDGSALAIELAAGRYPSLGVDGLLAGLDDRLRYLTTGSAPADRHSSVRTTIAWSVDLLDGTDRSVLESVWVFNSWFDAAAARSVVEPAAEPAVSDALARLVDHHLLLAVPGQPTRYRALEIIRQFARSRLTVEHLEILQDRHRCWCSAQLAELARAVPDDAWCSRFDEVVDDVRATVGWAAEHGRPALVRQLTEQLAALLLQRGQLEEAQHRYEQAAEYADSSSDSAHLLRLAAGVAAARVTGNDTLRLLDAAARRAESGGDQHAAAECRAWMVIYLNMMPGIIAVLPSPAEAARWLELTGPAADTPCVDVAVASGLPTSDPRASALATRSAESARHRGEPLVESVALDQLCALELVRQDLDGARRCLRRRGEVLDALPLDASTAYQFNDYLLMASEVHLAAGDLTMAGHYADRLAGLACYRDQAHLATSRRIKVDALAGDLVAAARLGDRFRDAWQRAGRPVARTLNVTCCAVAMVHGLLGNESRRAEWYEITRTLTREAEDLTGCRTGWAPTFDGIVLLDRDQHDAALERLSVDVDDDVWSSWNVALWRPWYAAVWVEAAVLAGAEDVPDRLQRGLAATQQNSVATTIVRRADAFRRTDLDALREHAVTFGRLGCPYQQRRTVTLLDRLSPRTCSPDRGR